MWEDNNPLSYGSSPPTSPYDHIQTPFGHRPSSPSAASSENDDVPDFTSKIRDPEDGAEAPDTAPGKTVNDTDTDIDEEEEDYYGGRRKKGGYSSRVEQILWEVKDMEIFIVDAGKNMDGSGGNFIAYTIRTGDLEVRRRYSEFASLRANLVLLHPTLIIPPIPEKHSMSDYVAAPTRAKEDQGIIEHRRRMLGVFLNRCARMKQIRKDTVFMRFLDPNASWSEVLHSPPISTLPKHPLRAPPIDPSRPSPAHQYLPIPPANSKLKNVPSPPTSPDTARPTDFTHTRSLPSTTANLSEADLDPYFIAYEGNTRAYETLLTSGVEKVNRRMLNRLSNLSTDMSELGARYNAFSLSEPAPTLGPAIEKVGQAVDSTYLATEELAAGLASGFTEPIRESAQFAGVVRSVLKYRMMKRVQEEITRDELAKAKMKLEQLEKSELEARRIEHYLAGSGVPPTSGGGGGPTSGGAGMHEEPPRRNSDSSVQQTGTGNRPGSSGDSDAGSVDSDFPPTHSSPMPPPISTSPIPYPTALPGGGPGGSSPQHRKASSFSNPLSYPVSKIFGKLTHAVSGIVDADPETTRRNNIGKTRETMVQMEAALQVAGRDVEDAGKAVLADLHRFQGEKETDMRKLMINFAKCQIEWAKKNLESWEDAKAEVDKITIPEIGRAVWNNKDLWLPAFHCRVARSHIAFKTSSALRKRKLFDGGNEEDAAPSPRSQTPNPPTEFRPSTPTLVESSTASLPSSSASIGTSASEAAAPAPTSAAPVASASRHRSSSPFVKSSSSLQDSSYPSFDSSSLSFAYARSDDGIATPPGYIPSPQPSQMVESQAATPQPSQLDASETVGSLTEEVNGSVEPKSPNGPQDGETPADTGKMDIDEEGAKPSDENKSTLRRSPSVDMITSPPPIHIEEPSESAPPQAEETLDDTVERIRVTSDSMPVEGKKYYVVEGKWWRRFLAQLSDYEPSKEDDFDISSPVPPLDTSDLIDHVELLPGGKTFPVLKEDLQMIIDFDIVPQEIWEELVSMYGINEKSPVLCREAINTADRDAKANIIVDLHPPVYTVYLLTPSSNTATFTQLKENAQNKAPRKIMMGKIARFQELLLEIKIQLGLESRDKIRLWRFKPSQGQKPPPTAKIDMMTFLEFEYGNNREPIDLPDNTKQLLLGQYNGRMTLVGAGITQEKYLIVEVEEEGEWPSERVSKALRLSNTDSLPVRVTKGTQVTQSVSSAKATANNKARGPVTRSAASPAPAVTRNVMTRRDGRAPGAVGFSNLGNTCYMNSALQCIKSVEELSRYFIDGLHKKELNPKNPISSGGRIATMYAQLIQTVYNPNVGSTVAPREFKGAVGKHNSIFSGYGQQDSQEFVSYLLDILHEDLNRIHNKPAVEFPDSTDEMVGDDSAIAKLAEENWELYRKRNDSVIIDLFAGMYKSTVICPVCDKTSIKFDPWLSCQLPLPMENLWTKAITFVPSGASATSYERLVIVHVEMEKYGTIKQLKDFVSKRLGVDSKKMVVSEVFRNKFYKHHEDNKSVSEAIMPNDQIYVYEVEDTPTNFPPPKRKKPMTMTGRLTMSTMFASWDDEESEDDFEKTETQELLVPVFNRLYKDNRRMGADLFGIPSFIVLNREEQKDPDAILKKLVSNLQKFTTSDMYSPDLSPKRPGNQKAGSNASEPNVLEEEGEVVNMPAVKIDSDTDTGTEDFVDVKMGDAESELNVEMSPTPATTQSDSSERVLDHWRTLFTTKIMPRKGYVVLPTAWNGIELNLELMKSRVVEVPEEEPEPVKKTNGNKYLQSPPASDESDADAGTDTTGADMMDASDEDVTEPAPKPKTTFSTVSSTNFYGNGTSTRNLTVPKKALSRKAGKQPATSSPIQGPLVKLGEGLVCDWNQEAFDAVFGGRSGDSFRGSSYFDAAEEFVDEELLKKRKTREARRRRGVHIDDCFDEFGREEILNDDNQWYCPRCKEHRNAKKSMQIYRVPDIIALQFKRFSSTRSFRDKIDAAIEFPIEGLDLNGRVLESDGKGLVYDLIAVDNHFGGLGGGHYTANARNWPDKKWYYFDDSSARQTPAGSINGSAAYLVFYRRRSTGILGGPVMEDMLAKSMTRSLEDEDEESPNGSGSPNGDPSFSGTRYSSGLQASSSQGYSAGDGQRLSGVGGIQSLIGLPNTGATRSGVSAVSSFATSGQTTPPPEEKIYKSFQITPDDSNNYYGGNPSRPPIAHTTLFGSPSVGASSGFRGSGLGAHHDFGTSSRAYGYDGIGMDEGLEADDDDDVDLIGPSYSPNGTFQDSDDDDLEGFMYGPQPMSLMSPGYYDFDSESIPGAGKISFAPHFSIMSRESPHVERYEQVREELASTLEKGSYAMTLVNKRTLSSINKPCVLIVTSQKEVEEEVTALCEGMGLEIEIVEGEPSFNYDVPEGYIPNASVKKPNDIGTLIGPADAPGKFSAVALYVKDKASGDIYALTTASAFASRDPEKETNIPPRFLTTLLPEGSVVTQPPGGDADTNAFGTLTAMHELDIVEMGDGDGQCSMFNYALVKVNKDKVGGNLLMARGIKRPITGCGGVSEVPEKIKVVVVAEGGQKEAKYSTVVVDVHDTGRFRGQPFQMYALFGEGSNLTTPGTLGSLCCAAVNVGFRGSGMIGGRAMMGTGYGGGASVLHFVMSVDWIFDRVKDKWGVELEVL
ncbi:hypothetical protein H072_11509 [Dactylellina haptotyla CBS 200.50]|uniref:Uncharacterized protein n=1 Tax=Dactylellina haptotyla (strain CBS 200.50) TaxID=1284197 RepID=S8B872_DACHA|nr:hypothetical protein H072_11509 [Dactylellina haptotyla CBS 200.50]